MLEKATNNAISNQIQLSSTIATKLGSQTTNPKLVRKKNLQNPVTSEEQPPTQPPLNPADISIPQKPPNQPRNKPIPTPKPGGRTKLTRIERHNIS